MNLATPYEGIPVVTLWEAISKRNKVLLVLNWTTKPMSIDEITEAIYAGNVDEAHRNRVKILLSVLKKNGLIEAPRRGHWIGLGHDPNVTGGE